MDRKIEKLRKEIRSLLLEMGAISDFINKFSNPYDIGEKKAMAASKDIIKLLLSQEEMRKIIAYCFLFEEFVVDNPALHQQWKRQRLQYINSLKSVLAKDIEKEYNKAYDSVPYGTLKTATPEFRDWMGTKGYSSWYSYNLDQEDHFGYKKYLERSPSAEQKEFYEQRINFANYVFSNVMNFFVSKKFINSKTAKELISDYKDMIPTENLSSPYR